jgi:diphthamide synthase (EF-2-diphthine--ammonia ligase)
MVLLPMPCDDQTYRQRIGSCMDRLRERGVQQVVFGDLFLEDIRRYREEQMQGSGIAPVFPLWQRDTGQLARDMIRCGLRAVVTCVDRRVLPAEYAGRWYDDVFLEDLPPGVDPCGENGEFHTLVTAGPMLTQPIAVQVGGQVCRGDFVFADVLLPAQV